MATPVKIGAEFLVSSASNGDKTSPSIAALPDGQFVVGWDDLLQPNGGIAQPSLGIEGQYFNANGVISGSEFDVANVGSPFGSRAFDPNLVGLANGAFSAGYTWYSQASQPTDNVSQVLFSGTAAGARNTLAYGLGGNGAGNAEHVRQAQLANGDIVAAWNYEPGAPTIYADILSSSGALLQSLTVSTGSDAQSAASVAALSNGGFVVTWQDTTANTVVMQRYDGSGNAVGGNAAVPAHLAGAQSAPAVAGLVNGQFVTVFEDTSGAYAGDTSDKAIVARVFNADGTAAGDFLVDTTGNGDQSAPTVTAWEGYGEFGFFVVWVDASGTEGAGGSGTAIRGQLFKPDGAGSFVKDGSEILINTYTAGDQLAPSVTSTFDGRIIVSWQTAAGVLDPNGTGISAQIIDPRQRPLVMGGISGTQIYGTRYNDVIFAEAGTVFIGGGGFDTVIETQPDVTINVGAGTTLYQVQEVLLNGGTNVVNGSYSSDFIYLYGGGANSANTMTLGSGGGYEISVGGINHMFGGASPTATDVFIGGIGASDMHGGTGNNVYYSGANDTVSGAGTYNTDVLLAPGVTLTNGGNISNVQQVILNGGTNLVDMTGSADFDILFGGPGTNTMTLGAGGGYEFATGGTNHMLGDASGSGTDVFIGGIGTSDMHGGGGSNVYYVGANDSVVGGGTYNTLTALAPGLQLTQVNASDVQSYYLNGGHNVIDASASSKPVIMIEQSNSSSDTFTGGSGNDVLLAYGDGPNILNGGPGDDVLIGYGQNDVIFQPGSGHDVVEARNAIYDLTAFAAVGIHSISDLTITDVPSSGYYQLVVQMGSDSFSMFEGTPGSMHLTAADFRFA